MLNEDDIRGKIVSEDACKKINVTINSETAETMSLYELSRWNSLLEAVEIIDRKEKQVRKPPTNWVKPIAIQKFIDERTPSMLHELAIERNAFGVFVAP
jgi:hypothetical protein